MYNQTPIEKIKKELNGLKYVAGIHSLYDYSLGLRDAIDVCHKVEDYETKRDCYVLGVLHHVKALLFLGKSRDAIEVLNEALERLSKEPTVQVSDTTEAK